MSKTISELLGKQPPQGFGHRVKPADTKFGIYDGMVGIEVEVENYVAGEAAVNYTQSHLRYFWNIDKDTSLKNKGVELISFPLIKNGIDEALVYLEKFLSLSQEKVDFSHRTSVHVHLNVLDMTIEQLTNLVTAYACVERLFFSRTKKERHGNSYCYPLTDTNPDDKLLTTFNPKNKYCAFNVAPVITQGTVEFRHMHGTSDREELTRWIQMILKLREFVMRTPTEALWETVHMLNTTSHYSQFVHTVFHPLGFLFSDREYQEMMEYEVAWAKLFIHSGRKDFLKYSGFNKKVPTVTWEVDGQPVTLDDLLEEDEDPQEPNETVEF